MLFIISLFIISIYLSYYKYISVFSDYRLIIRTLAFWAVGRFRGRISARVGEGTKDAGGATIASRKKKNNDRRGHADPVER